MRMFARPLAPPRQTGPDGRPRRIGVELEFSGLSGPAVAMYVQQLFGGTIQEIDTFRHCVAGGKLGEVTVELDMTIAHPAQPPEEGLAGKLKQTLHEAIGTLGILIMPLEVVLPPLPPERLPEVDRLVAALRRDGAVGTRDSLLNAFGLHLNVEVAALEDAYLLAHMRPFSLLAAWLRTSVDIDLARRLGPFTRPYPDHYVRRLADPLYRPDLGRLIDDYLDANPTRDRELDMLPVFAAIDLERIRARGGDSKLKPRPAFHYRLPNSEVDRPDWGVVEDWNRWVAVERLAANSGRLAALGQRFLDVYDGKESAAWVAETAHWAGG
jgi:hypothetical protein